MSKQPTVYLRASLLASVALLALPVTAQAQTAAGPLDSVNLTESAHKITDSVKITSFDVDGSSSRGAPSLLDLVEAPHGNVISVHDLKDVPHAPLTDIVGSVETPDITINNNFTPTQAYDPTNVTGIGQMVVDAGGGFIGTCTATLINPRTVIFAAHCVNTRAATDYGANSGGTAIGFGFETNTRANAAGQPDELVQWLLGNADQRFKTNKAQSFYNALQVYWNPASTAATSCTNATSCFLEADIAMAALDTPATGVPTWALLFSPLPAPGSIDTANGTGYHVTSTGYGAFGTGTTGAASNGNYRRRAAENMLGALVSLDQRNVFLYGAAGAPSRPQGLYFLDFDDPTRTNGRDFNGFRDNALQREGLTGPGDSGGPLILDRAFSKQVVLGVLSGGSTFYNGQQGGSYGTQSFYQPLFLYWDWIVANNPYRYVTAKAGNSTWEDATHWLTELDPNYQIISGGNLVNGVPTNLGAGKTPVTGFGEMCFQSGATNVCEDIRTGTVRNNVPNGGADTSMPDTINLGGKADTSMPDTVNVVGNASGLDIGDSIDSPHAPVAGYSDTVTAPPTLANGLPGATNFVPNNSDGVRATGVSARYYDVTLRNTGNTTLSSTAVIDNFTILGAGAQLTVNSAGSLRSLTQINQRTGTIRVDGTIGSVGDYLMESGLLTGSGRVNSPFLTSVLGTIAPGTIGTIGNLTVSGNIVLASGSSLMIDLGPNNTSDKLIVIPNATAGSGTANIGGTVQFSPVSGHTIRYNDLYTILTASGGITGKFVPGTLSAILTPTFIYNPNSVQVRITAGSYANVVGNTPVQRAYAGLLDRNRGTNYNGLRDLYGFLDLQNAATIQATLESWAPRNETLARSLGTVAVENMNRFYAGRIASMDLSSGFDGSVAMIGKPIQLAYNNWTNVGMNSAAAVASDAQEAMLPTKLAEGTRGFIAGGYLDGHGRSMVTAIPYGDKDNFDGWYVAGGIETEVGENGAIGFGLSYTKMKGTTGGIAQSARGELFQGTLYGKTRTDSNIVLDAQVSAGLFSIKTQRAAVMGATSYDLRSKDNTLAVSTEIGLSKMFGSEALEFGPRVAVRASNIGYTPTIEKGGPMALYYDREDHASVQGLAGLLLTGNGKFRPYASAYFVHDFKDKPAAFGANFVGGVGPNAIFALNGRDQNWGELALGFTFGGEKVEFSVGADTTIFRKDVSNQAYRGSVTFRF